MYRYPPPPSDTFDRTKQFHDWLFGLDRHPRPDLVLIEALRFLVDDTGAALAYLEVFDDGGPGYQRAHTICAASPGEVRSQISESIMMRAIAERRTVVTPCAVADARFEAAGSVRRHEIHAAMCEPIMRLGGAILGVVYLQGRAGGPPFDRVAHCQVSALASAVARVASRLQWPEEKATYKRLVEHYAVSLIDEAFHRNGHNASAAARDLKIDRKTFYRRREREE